MNFRLLPAGIGFLCGLFLSSVPLLSAAPTDDPLAGLRPEHPRLLATSADWARLKTQVTTDPQLALINTIILEEARAVMKLKPVKRELTGRRLLSVSRNLVGRVLALSYAWQVTGDVAFVRRAEREMLAAAVFTDWNPSHFLDVGEATAALAIGYDWCFDELTPEARRIISTAILEKGIEPGLGPKNGWQRTENNWNQVCFGGLTLGALAIADEEPAVARQLLTLARAGNVHGLKPYAPDGVYPEGPSYWSYGTSYQVLLLAALESALGTDWGLADSPGFLPSAGAVLQATGPTGRFYNFADGGEGGSFEPALYWFARKLHDPGLLTFNQRRVSDEPKARAALAQNRALPLAALWWPQSPATDPTPELPLAWVGRGRNPMGVFRTAWTDPASLYLAFKGGAAELNHAHMDAGSFVLELAGVRWCIDLGSQSYESLESKGVDLWNRKQDSQRWQVYRLNNQSHSTLTINGQLHRVDGHATITDFSAEPENRHAIVELTPVFAGQATQVRRGFRPLSDRAVLVQDELSGLAPGATVRWQMPTRATVTLQGNAAWLQQGGHELRVEALSPGHVTWSVAPAEPPPDNFNARNPGVSMLSFTATAPADGRLRLAVRLGTDEAPAPLLTPLAAWAKPKDSVAAKPLFRDPVFDGAADPVVIWNPHVQRWWMFYTNRRANVPGLSGVAWVHGTKVGIAESADGGAHWSYLGTADIALPPEIGGTEPTLWAPDVITAPDGTHHMFLTVVPGVFENWQHPRRLVHLTSTDLHKWKYESALTLASDRVIDAAVYPLPGGGWRMWYNNERDRKSIYFADSADLFTWTDHGKCAGVGERPGEGPYVFSWKGRHWMLVDLWKGLGVYRSDDLMAWTAQPGDLLGVAGSGPDDGVNGGHPGVVVSGDRAYLFYFTHPGRNGTISPDDKDNLDLRRSSIQVTELFEQDGVLSCDRNAPTQIQLTAPHP